MHTPRTIKFGDSTDCPPELMGRRDKPVGVKTKKAPNSAEGAGIAVAEHGASAAEAYGFVGFVLTGAFRAPKPNFLHRSCLRTSVPCITVIWRR